MTDNNVAKVLADIERDFDWRQTELFHARELFLGLDSERHRSVMLRSLVMLLYAHFEGFVKFSLQSYVDSIKLGGFNGEDVKEELIAFALRKNFTSLAGKASLTNRQKFVTDFKRMYHGPLPLKDLEVDTKSNLKSTVLDELLNELGLQFPSGGSFVLDKNTATRIDTVTNKRNAIAHGRPATVKDFSEYVKLEQSTLEVMSGIATLVEHNLTSQGFRNSPSLV